MQKSISFLFFFVLIPFLTFSEVSFSQSEKSFFEEDSAAIDNVTSRFRKIRADVFGDDVIIAAKYAESPQVLSAHFETLDLLAYLALEAKQVGAQEELRDSIERRTRKYIDYTRSMAETYLKFLSRYMDAARNSQLKAIMRDYQTVLKVSIISLDTLRKTLEENMWN